MTTTVKILIEGNKACEVKVESDGAVPMLVCSGCAMERHALAVLVDKETSERAEREREFDAAGGAA